MICHLSIIYFFLSFWCFMVQVLKLHYMCYQSSESSWSSQSSQRFSACLHKSSISFAILAVSSSDTYSMSDCLIRRCTSLSGCRGRGGGRINLLVVVMTSFGKWIEHTIQE